jgi:hypothetical protein
MEVRLEHALHVFPRVPEGAKFPGWDGTNDASALLMSEKFPGDELTYELDDGDYRFVVYDIPGEESIPRINNAAIPVLEGMGVEPVARAAVIDVDLPGHRRWSSLAEAQAHVDALLARAEDDPQDLLFNAAYYTTRAGYRLVWMLTDPLPVRKYRALMRALMATLKEQYGIDSDPSSDEWNRLFRMPRCIRDGVLLDTYADVDPLAEATLDPYRFGELADNDEFVSEVAGDAPEPIEDLDLDVWKAAHKHAYLKRGLPFPPDNTGSTYRAMRRAVASLAHEGPCDDPEVLFAMVVRSVDATPGRTRQEAWKLCVWTAYKQRGAALKPEAEPERPLRPEPVDDDTWDDWFRTIDKRYASTLNKLRAGLAFTPKTQAEAKLLNAIFHVAHKLHLTDPLDLYRAFYASAQASLVDATKVWEQAVTCAAQVKSEADNSVDDEGKKAAVFCSETPLLVAVPGARVLYMLDLRDPGHPTYQLTDSVCMTMHFDQMARQHLPFDASITDDKGKAQDIGSLMRSYGNSATTVRYVTGQRGASFVPDRDGNALEIGVHSLHPDLRPVFHADVDKWLRLFGGSDPERFLDWLAVSTRTQFPVCAMYIHGLPGSGKSMLLQGLAAMWGGSPVPFGNVAADFNESLLASPIIGADEGVPSDKGDLSEVFRNLVANSTHDIRIKYQANATLHACMRLVITANEMDALDFKKTLSGRSLQAIVERVLFIEQGSAPVDHLAALGGRTATALWAERAPGVPGLIGEHVLWLRENRPVEPAGRFLVQGTMTDWHRQFISQQGIKPDVIKVIALAAKNAAKLSNSGAQVAGVEVRRDKRCVLITKEAVVTSWSTQRGDAPRERALNKTLGQLDEKDRVGLTRPRMGRANPSAGTRAYAISFDTLVASQYVTLGTLTGKEDDDE